VDIEPFDDTEGPSPIELNEAFRIPFPSPYPPSGGMFAKEGHWTLGGHLTYGNFGNIECTTCHSFHGSEETGPVKGLLSKDPVNERSNEFCEGCHRGERGDDNRQPPYPNPGGTTTGRTYHAVDDDEANGAGWNVAIADTVQLDAYQWGEEDIETERRIMLCTTCHVAHNGMENSPALIDITEEIMKEGVDTFCEICHREPPEGHHGYADNGDIPPELAQQIARNEENLGRTYGDPSFDRIYCSHCHRAHNAGYSRNEENFIPILVDTPSTLCLSCHSLGVSHFLGDPTLPSTYDDSSPPLYRWPWPLTGLESSYDGDEDIPMTLTCLSCHYLTSPGEDGVDLPSRLLAPADENSVWTTETPEDYLCTGCHMLDNVTFGEAHTHPTMDANRFAFPDIYTDHLLDDELAVTYTDEGRINCHSCHRTHNAVTRGGVYILKVVGGENLDPKAIQPKIDFTDLCHSCHPSDEY
jgi:predicted CXXCH cytochrome family protein